MSAGRVLPVVFGIAVILWCFRPGMTFYPGGMGIASKDRPLPKWLGRLWFIFIGSWLIAMGLSNGERFNRILSTSFAILIGVICLCAGMWPGWMAERTNQSGSHAWRGRIIVLLVGVIFLCVGLNELRH